MITLSFLSSNLLERIKDDDDRDNLRCVFLLKSDSIKRCDSVLMIFKSTIDIIFVEAPPVISAYS